MEKICECKAICAFRGNGKLTLTDSNLAWNKTAASFILFGASAALTDNFINIPLEDIDGIEKYTFLEGGGLKVTTKSGEIIKFSIKPKKAFILVFDYIQNRFK